MELHVLEKSSQNEFVQCHSSPLLFSKLDAHTHTHTVFKCVLLVNTNAFGEVKPNIFICSIATHRIIRNKIFFCECFFHCLFVFFFLAHKIQSHHIPCHKRNSWSEFFSVQETNEFFFLKWEIHLDRFRWFACFTRCHLRLWTCYFFFFSFIQLYNSSNILQNWIY